MAPSGTEGIRHPPALSSVYPCQGHHFRVLEEPWTADMITVGVGEEKLSRVGGREALCREAIFEGALPKARIEEYGPVL